MKQTVSAVINVRLDAPNEALARKVAKQMQIQVNRVVVREEDIIQLYGSFVTEDDVVICEPTRQQLICPPS